MTYATRLLTRKQMQGNDKRNDDIKSNRIKKKAISKRDHTPAQYKSNTSNRTRSLRSNINNSLNCTKRREELGFKKVMVSDILAIRNNDDEEYALLAYKDTNLIPDWQPVRNLRNATALLEKFWQKQASRSCQLVNGSDSSSNITVDDSL
ncbi:19339_t:CDS:2 [Dentiscutata erythropus]|uniref:19339_t:CDS:1 n=1 Tax=Dentiscutata erythropus TaxID=1348616 RepID=A0A9N9NN40_9GLOM|nr:19339_t:CDS:2 [Dentiscutata erythropus]